MMEANFTEILNSMNQWFWFAFAVLLTILEVVLGASFFLLWLGISAAFIGFILLAYADILWQSQLLLFAAVSLACLLYWHRHIKHRASAPNPSNLNRRSERYVGNVYVLKEPIINGVGRLQIHDTIWKIEGPDLPANTKVKVVKAYGVVLKVQQDA